jgi:hypothetical protein
MDSFRVRQILYCPKGAFDLSKRLNNYYKRSNLTRNSKSCINNAILNHGYSSFSVTIMEYIEISNLTKAEARKLILEREQHYQDIIFFSRG